jgi:putative ABC transport system permease protein
MELTPYYCEIGEILPLMTKISDEGMTELGSVTIKRVVNHVPDIIPGALFDGRLINIFIPESIYTRLLTENEAILKPETETYYVVSTADPDSFTARAAELFAQYPAAEDENRTIQNISQMTRLNYNITVVVMLFGYGFIAMLSLIAVTSVVATISTGMALRRQEFAMLFSVGMTPEGMNKMLNLESLLYGLKSLLIGLPVGVVLSLLIHKAMTNTIVFAYSPPIIAMIISAAAVMVLTFGTMRYGKRKLSKISIVEAIRNETV